MSKGPKKKPARSKARSKTGAKKAAKGKAQSKAQSTAQTAAEVKAAPKSPPESRPDQELPSQADAAAGDSSAGPKKKTGAGKAAVAVIVFLGVLGAGAYVNWIFWSETVPEKAGPEKTGTQADGTTPEPEPKPKPGPEPASKEIAPPDVQKDAQKDAPKAAPKAFPGDSAEDSAEKLAAERRQLRQALDRLMARMESIEKSLEQVKKIAQATTAPAEKPGSSTALEGIPGRLDSLEESGGKIKRLVQRMDKMEKDYAEKIAPGFIAPARDAGAGPVADSTPDAGAVVLAVVNLRQALATNEPFDKALDALKALAGDSPEIGAAVTLLAKNAPKGLATGAVLAKRFEALAGKIVQASREVEEKNWLDRAVNRMSKLVSWRRVDGKGGKSSVDALVADAETRLKAGDLKTAIKAVEGLSVNARAAAVAASWLADAEARLAADRAIAGLHLHVLSLLAPAPLTPLIPRSGDNDP